jgi:hypothetical protein
VEKDLAIETLDLLIHIHLGERHFIRTDAEVFTRAFWVIGLVASRWP